MEAGTTYKAKEESRENGLAEFADHVGSFGQMWCMFIRTVCYRATDADIPARPRFLLLDASADVIESPMCRRADKNGGPKTADKHVERIAAVTLGESPRSVEPERASANDRPRR